MRVLREAWGSCGLRHRPWLSRARRADRWAVLWDECIYVGDADHDLHVAVGEAFGNFDLIQVAGSVIIDGRPEQIPKVTDLACGTDLRGMSFQFGKLLRNLRRELRLETALLHDLLCGLLQVDFLNVDFLNVDFLNSDWRRIGVGHELPIDKVGMVQAIMRNNAVAEA